MSEQTWCVIFNCQDPSTTIRIEKDTGRRGRQSIDLTYPGTDYRAIHGLTAEQAQASAEDLIARGYATQYRVL